MNSNLNSMLAEWGAARPRVTSRLRSTAFAAVLVVAVVGCGADGRGDCPEPKDEQREPGASDVDRMPAFPDGYYRATVVSLEHIAAEYHFSVRTGRASEEDVAGWPFTATWNLPASIPTGEQLRALGVDTSRSLGNAAWFAPAVAGPSGEVPRMADLWPLAVIPAADDTLYAKLVERADRLLREEYGEPPPGEVDAPISTTESVDSSGNDVTVLRGIKSWEAPGRGTVSLSESIYIVADVGDFVVVSTLGATAMAADNASWEQLDRLNERVIGMVEEMGSEE